MPRPLWESAWQLLMKLNTPACDPAIPLPGVGGGEVQSTERKRRGMLIAAFTENDQNSSGGEWMSDCGTFIAWIRASSKEE